MNWKNKVLLITGSGSGIGLATALEAGTRGALIVLNGRKHERLEKAGEILRSRQIPYLIQAGDISDYDTCTQIVENSMKHFGRIDLLINNAAVNAIASFGELQPEVFRKVVDINLIGSFNMARAALPHILESKGGILFCGSLMGIHGMGNYSAYGSTKMALRALTESLRIELQGSAVYIGLAYICCTDNSPDKVFLDKSGADIPEPPRRRIGSRPPEEVAVALLRMVERRKSIRYFSLLGKINALINHLFPAIIHLVFRKTYVNDRKLQAQTAMG